jgi:hypothetical protein
MHELSFPRLTVSFVIFPCTSMTLFVLTPNPIALRSHYHPYIHLHSQSQPLVPVVQHTSGILIILSQLTEHTLHINIQNLSNRRNLGERISELSVGGLSVIDIFIRIPGECVTDYGKVFVCVVESCLCGDLVYFSHSWLPRRRVRHLCRS